MLDFGHLCEMELWLGILTILISVILKSILLLLTAGWTDYLLLSKTAGFKIILAYRDIPAYLLIYLPS